MVQPSWQRKICRATTIKLRERAKKEAAMLEFEKRFVGVEWLAFQKVVDLIREAGFDNSYFVSQSNLIGDEGQAPVLAEMGRELYDREGQLVKSEELRAEDFGLAEEIGEFAQRSEDSGRGDEKYFLKRTYAFQIFQKGEKFSISAWVSFAKRTDQDDWELVHEGLTDQSRSGDARWVIYRSDKK